MSRKTQSNPAWYDLDNAAKLYPAHATTGSAHGVTDVANIMGVLERMAEPQPGSGATELFAHEAPGLGIIAVTAAQRTPHGVHVVAHGFPFAAGGLVPLLDALRAEFGVDAPLHRLGRIALDADAAVLTAN